MYDNNVNWIDKSNYNNHYNNIKKMKKNLKTDKSMNIYYNLNFKYTIIWKKKKKK